MQKKSKLILTSVILSVFLVGIFVGLCFLAQYQGWLVPKPPAPAASTPQQPTSTTVTSNSNSGLKEQKEDKSKAVVEADKKNAPKPENKKSTASNNNTPVKRDELKQTGICKSGRQEIIRSNCEEEGSNCSPDSPTKP